jgi:hypothetical protein
MGGFGYSEVSLAWGIPFPSYIKSSRLHTIIIQMLLMEKIITLSDAYHKAIKWFLHHMNILVLFTMYIRSLDILELNIFIAFSLLITIGEVCSSQRLHC